MGPKFTPPSPLKLARIARGAKQRDLAVIGEMSPAKYCRLETGRGPTRITPEIMARIADVLGVPAVILFGKRGNST